MGEFGWLGRWWWVGGVGGFGGAGVEAEELGGRGWWW